MANPGTGGGDLGGPVGHTYAALVVAGAAPEEVTAHLRELRFSGWIAPPETERGWIAVVAARGNGTVAAGRRGVAGVGEALAAKVTGPVVALRVVDDRQLLMIVWDGDELGRYLSDPSYGLDRDDDTLPYPYGVEHARDFAVACSRAENADDLAELLGEELDPDNMIESERLARVLALLGLPEWLVAASSLPRDIPTGPAARDLVRLGAGRPGAGGWLRGRLADVVRARRPPPPAVPDAPRGLGPDIDPWLL